MTEGTCSVDDCGDPERSLGWCDAHYKRFWRYGDPLGGGTRRGAARAFYLANKDTVTDECIIWPYAVTTYGYGEIKLNGVRTQVHILACVNRWGPAPAGMVATHGPCHNRLCFNGAHLSWQTRAGNTADKRRDGTWFEGERCPHARLTESKVREIRAAYAAGVTQHALADEYGMQQPTISRIIHRHAWKHVA